MPKGVPNSEEITVQPIETVDKIPVKKTGELCWNCKNYEDRQNYLDKDGNCEVCGFTKSTMYNGQIEADRIAQIVEARQQAEQETISKRTAELLKKG